MMTDDGVVRASEDDGLDVRIKFPHILFDGVHELGSIVVSFFNKGNQSWSSNFLNRNGAIVEVYTLLVCPYFYGRLGRKNPHFSVPRFNYFFRTGDSDPEDFTIRESNLLQIFYGMRSGSIAGKYDDGGSLVKEKLHSFLGILTYGRVSEIPIRTAGIVAEITVIILWQ